MERDGYDADDGRETAGSTDGPRTRRGFLGGLGAAGLGLSATARLAGGASERGGTADAPGDATPADAGPSLAWTVTYGGDGPAGASALSRTDAGDFLVAGTGPDAELATVSGDGTLRSTVDVAGYDRFSGLALGSDGGYALVSGGSVVAFAADGAREWATAFDPPADFSGGHYQPEALVPTADGGYAVAGAFSVRTRGSAEGDTFAWAGTVDCDGDVGWNRVFEDPSGPSTDDDRYPATVDRFHALVQVDDGTLVAGGVDGFWNDSGELLGEPRLAGFDPADGSERPVGARIPSDENYWYGEVTAMTPTADGGFAAYGWLADPSRYDEFVAFAGDDAGAYRVAAPAQPTALVQTADGGLVLGGYTSTTPQERDAVLVGLPGVEAAVPFREAAERDVVTPRWRRTLGTEGRADAIRDLAATPGGGVAGAGSAGDRAWVVKLGE